MNPKWTHSSLLFTSLLSPLLHPLIHIEMLRCRGLPRTGFQETTEQLQTCQTQSFVWQNQQTQKWDDGCAVISPPFTWMSHFTQPPDRAIRPELLYTAVRSSLNIKVTYTFKWKHWRWLYQQSKKHLALFKKFHLNNWHLHSWEKLKNSSCSSSPLSRWLMAPYDKSDVTSTDEAPGLLLFLQVVHLSIFVTWHVLLLLKQRGWRHECTIMF